MKSTAKHAVIMIMIASAFVIGLVILFANIYTNSGAWVTKRNNQHIYSEGRINTMGAVLDRKGRALAQSSGQKRSYHSDLAIRKATLHVVGDLNGYIATGVQTVFSKELIGYDFLNGLYHAGDAKGNDVYLTIDAEVSAKALQSLGNRKGAVAVYNYQTGEIICLVSTPTYDPENKPADIETNPAFDGAYLNRCLSSTFAPGSIFKVVTAAAAIDNLPDINNREFKCTGSFETEGGKITCNGVHGKVGFNEAFTKSCNIAFAQIAIELGPKLLTEQAEKMGFGTNFRMDGIRLAKSSINLNHVNSSELGWAGIGQHEDLANPYHMMMIMGAVANGGTPIKPHLVDTIPSPSVFGGRKGSAVSGDAMLTPSAANLLSKMMRSNVKNSYGDNNFPGLEVCAKTGTAQVGNGREPNAWFVGFCQNKDYPLAFVVIVEDAGFGIDVAMPVARDVLAAAKKALRK